MRLIPMFRSVDVIMIALLIGVVSWTFKVKHDSQAALERVAEIEREIAAERIEIDLLKSDWSLLTSPARLQSLAERYSEELGLQVMEPEQIADKEQLPAFRPVESPGSPNDIEGHASSADPLTTGAIDGFANGGESQ